MLVIWASLWAIWYLAQPANAFPSCTSPRQCVSMSRAMSGLDRLHFLRKVVVIWPTNTALGLETARALERSGHYEEALECLARLNPTEPRPSEAVRIFKARLLFDLLQPRLGCRTLKMDAVRDRAEERFSMAVRLYVHGLISSGELKKAECWINVISAWPLVEKARALLYVEKARMAALRCERARTRHLMAKAVGLWDVGQLRLLRAGVELWAGNFPLAKHIADTVLPASLAPELRGLPELFRRVGTGINIDTNRLINRQLREFPSQQMGYLVASAIRFRNGQKALALRTLGDAQRLARSQTLLSPSWAGVGCSTVDSAWYRGRTRTAAERHASAERHR